MAIDDPIDKVKEILSERDDEILDAIIPFASLFSPLLLVYATVKGIFNAKEQKARIIAALRALCNELQSMQEKFPSDAQSALNSDWFRRGVQVLIEQSARATTEQRAITLARALAHGCFPSEEHRHRQEDLASYIEDIARLGTDDIQMLKLLRDAYATAIKTAPNMNNPDIFAAEYGRYVEKADELKIHPDDRVALSGRLCGFGLAYEGSIQPFPGQHFVRPTRRGLYLLSLLEAAETPIDRAN